MSCYWGHDWTKWTEPEKRTMYILHDGKRHEHVKQYQNRTCKTCNMQEEREL